MFHVYYILSKGDTQTDRLPIFEKSLFETMIKKQIYTRCHLLDIMEMQEICVNTE